MDGRGCRAEVTGERSFGLRPQDDTGVPDGAWEVRLQVWVTGREVAPCGMRGEGVHLVFLCHPERSEGSPDW